MKTGFKIYSDRDGELWIRQGKKVRYLCNCCSLTELASRKGRKFKEARSNWDLKRVGEAPKADPAFQIVRSPDDDYVHVRRVSDNRATFLFINGARESEGTSWDYDAAYWPLETEDDRFRVKVEQDGRTAVVRDDGRKAYLTQPGTPVREDVTWVAS